METPPALRLHGFKPATLGRLRIYVLGRGFRVIVNEEDAGVAHKMAWLETRELRMEAVENWHLGLSDMARVVELEEEEETYLGIVKETTRVANDRIN